MKYLNVKPEGTTEKILWWLLWFLRLDILGGIIWMYFAGNWEAFGINIVALILTFAPDLAIYKYNIKLPIDYVFVMVLFIYLSMFLGSGFDVYESVWWWDAALHVVSGLILSFAGFLILFLSYENNKVQASPFMIALFTFCFGVALGAVWEIFEYAIDQLFGTNLQRSGLQDTMWDLIVDALGAFVMAWIGYDIIKNNRKGGFVYRAIDRFIRTNND